MYSTAQPGGWRRKRATLPPPRLGRRVPYPPLVRPSSCHTDVVPVRVSPPISFPTTDPPIVPGLCAILSRSRFSPFYAKPRQNWHEPGIPITKYCDKHTGQIDVTRSAEVLRTRDADQQAINLVVERARLTSTNLVSSTYSLIKTSERARMRQPKC